MVRHPGRFPLQFPVNQPQPGFVTLALSRKVALPAIRVALVVGSVLALINHGDALLKMQLESTQLLQIALTYLVPYSVATYSSVRAIQGEGKRS